MPGLGRWNQTMGSGWRRSSEGISALGGARKSWRFGQVGGAGEPINGSASSGGWIRRPEPRARPAGFPNLTTAAGDEAPRKDAVVACSAPTGWPRQPAPFPPSSLARTTNDTTVDAPASANAPHLLLWMRSRFRPAARRFPEIRRPDEGCHERSALLPETEGGSLRFLTAPDPRRGST